MNRATLGQFRAAATATPYHLPVGICPTDIPSISALVNYAQERLLGDPLTPDEGWWGGWARMAFTISCANPYIVTPRDVARLILIDVCKKPVFIRNSWWEFLEFGRGFQPSGCNSQCTAGSHLLQAFERETVPTLSPFVGPKKVRVIPTDDSDVGKTVILQGPDQNSVQVTSKDPLTGATTLGEQLSLAFPFVDSAYVYNDITGIQKDNTFGRVQFFQVDSGGNSTPLSEMEPSEKTSQYRKYFVNGLPVKCCNPTTPDNTVQVLAMAKLDFIPVQADPDYLIIQSIPALLQECQCIRLEGMESSSSQELAVGHHARAIQLLNGQLDHFLGKTRTAIKMPLGGSDRFALNPV